MILGLSGYAQAGKDTAGRFLVEEHGYVRYAFADKLRSFLYAENPFVDPPNRVQDIVDRYGWERAKLDFAEVRGLLQRLGTEAGRKILGENVWVDAVFNDIKRDGIGEVVITDVRFPNEAQMIKERGGLVVRINRPEVTAVNAHPSETSLDDWPFDLVVPNDGSLNLLRESMKWVVKESWRVVEKGPSDPLPGYGAPRSIPTGAYC